MDAAAHGGARRPFAREFRQTFENEMTERLTGMVERLTNRKVLTYQSQVLFDPHVISEMFVFDQPSSKDARMATAEGQIEDDSTGEATDEQALDAPSVKGQ